MERWQALVLDETAASSVEYGLLLAGIAFVIFSTVMSLGVIVKEKCYDELLALLQ